MPEAPEEPDAPHRLLHAEQITAADIDALTGFLLRRLHPLLLSGVHPAGTPGTEEHRTTQALEDTARTTAACAHTSLGQHGRYKDRLPAEADAALQRLLTLWNLLATMVHPWQGTDGYSTARWREVLYLSAEHEAFGRALQSGDEESGHV